MKIDYKEIIDEVRSKNFWAKFIVLLIGSFLLSINFNLILKPNNLATGGTSGIAVIVSELLPSVKSSTFVLISNILLLIVSFFLLGPKKTGLSVLGSIAYPVMMSLTEGLCIWMLKYVDLSDTVLLIVVSGTLYGTANGLLYKTGFTSGGADIIIQLITKYFKVPNGTASLIFNSAVLTTSAFVFGVDKALLGILIIIINSTLINKIMIGISDSKTFYIQTEKTQQIIEFLKENNAGYTIMKTEGGHTKTANDIIMTVVSTKDFYLYENVIKKIDPEVFLVINDCYEVYGGQSKQKRSLLDI